jgi:hypothetical protein
MGNAGRRRGSHWSTDTWARLSRRFAVKQTRAHNTSMRSSAQSPEEYLAELPEDRRIALTEVLNVVRTNLPEGYAEGMQYGHISFYVPHSRYPAGYHCDPS